LLQICELTADTNSGQTRSKGTSAVPKVRSANVMGLWFEILLLCASVVSARIVVRVLRHAFHIHQRVATTGLAGEEQQTGV
jgi:phage-related protein